MRRVRDREWGGLEGTTSICYLPLLLPCPTSLSYLPNCSLVLSPHATSLWCRPMLPPYSNPLCHPDDASLCCFLCPCYAMSRSSRAILTESSVLPRSTGVVRVVTSGMWLQGLRTLQLILASLKSALTAVAPPEDVVLQVHSRLGSSA